MEKRRNEKTSEGKNNRNKMKQNTRGKKTANENMWYKR